MNAILINPSARSVRIVKLESITAKEGIEEIARLLNASTAAKVSTYENDIVYADASQFANAKNAFILEGTPKKPPIFGNAIIVSWKTECDIPARLIDLQIKLLFFTTKYTRTIRERIKNKQRPVPIDEEIVGKTVRTFYRSKSKLHNDRSAIYYGIPENTRKFSPILKSMRVLSLKNSRPLS